MVSSLLPLLRIPKTLVWGIALYVLGVLPANSRLHAQVTLLPNTIFPSDSLVKLLSVAPNGSLYALGLIGKSFYRDDLLRPVIPLNLLPCSILYRSTDTARSWHTVPLPKEMSAFTMLKHRNNTLYLAGYSTSASVRSFGTALLAISEDNGANWVTRPIVSTFATIDIAVTSTGAIFAAVSNAVEPLRSSLFITRRDSIATPVKSVQILRSLNNGITWQELWKYETRSSLFSIDANSRGVIVALLENPPFIYPPNITLIPFFDGGVVSSFDDGRTWQARNPLLSPVIRYPSAAYQVSILPLSDTVAVLGAYFMRYFQKDSTNQFAWIDTTLVSDGFALSFAMHTTSQHTYFKVGNTLVEQNVRNRKTALFINEPFLYSPQSMVVLGEDIFAMSGTRLLRIRKNATTNVLSPFTAKDISIQTLSPNPTDHSSVLSFTLATPATVHYEVLNTLGQVLVASPKEERSSGEHRIAVNIEQIPSGVYTVRLTIQTSTGMRTETARLLVVR